MPILSFSEKADQENEKKYDRCDLILCFEEFLIFKIVKIFETS